MLPTNQLRQIHTTIFRLARGTGKRSTAGIRHQLKALENEERLLEDPEGFGELESDFMDLHKTHREHERQVQQQRENIRHLMVKHKYFRDAKLPNMLTFAEKEQMRLLHARDPEEWTAEKLAESFPATPAIVQKVLEAKWRPRSVERIRRHDETVIHNWEQFRTDASKLQLPPDLTKHLQKFATRRREDIEIPAESWPTRLELPKPKQQEFLSIITSCNKYAEPTEEKQISLPKPETETAVPPPHGSSRPENETYLLDKVVDKRKMRLQELKQLKLTQTEVENSEEVTPSITQQAAEKLQNPFSTGIVSTTQHSTLDYDLMQKYESNEIVVSAEDQQRYEMLRIKDRIHIPRKLRRKGATYRVEDCYYDDDGEFLYRVPGMTGSGRLQ